MSTTPLSATDSDGQLASYFVNAEEARAKFEEALAAKDGKRILDIVGGAGYGKSALLVILRARCSRDGIPVALADGDSAKDPVGVLESLAYALSQSGIPMGRFAPMLTKYQAVRRSANEHAPGLVESGAGARPAVFSEDMVDALSTLPVQPEDVKLYSEGAARLTAGFLHDLQDASATCIVLLIDRSEMFGSGDTGDWFREFLQAMPGKVRVVLAGSRPLPGEQFWSVTWPTWTKAVLSHKMDRLNRTDSYQLIERFAGVLTGDKAMPNFELTEKMWTWSFGTPALLCFALRYWHIQGGRFDVSQVLVVQGAYDRLLLGTPSELRSVLETAAIFRFFTRKTLRAIAQPDQTEAALRKLFDSAFVEVKGDRRAVVQDLRGTLNRKLQVDDPERFAELHHKAGDYCESREVELSASPQSEQSRKELLEWKLERLYHRFNEDKALGLAVFRSTFEDAFFRRRDFADCSAIWNDFCTYDLGQEARQFARYYEGLTAIYREKDPTKPAEILEALLHETLNDTLRAEVLEYLAAIYWYYNQLGEGGTEKARQFYEDCMALRAANGDNAGLARVKIWMGILAQRAQGQGKFWFDQALEICKGLPLGRDTERIRAWANQELSIRDRMAGRFMDSEDKIKSAIKTFLELQMPFDAAGAQFNYAMLLIWRGRLRQAEEELNAIARLYQRSPRSRIQENSWIKIGFGNIALGRFQFAKAIELFSSVENLGKEKEDRFVQSLGLGGLAECSIVEGRWDDALKFGTACLALQNRSTDKFGAGWSLHIMGLAYAGRGSFDEALKHLDDGLSVMREYGSGFGEARLLSAKCQVYAQKNDRDQFQHAAKALREIPGDRFFDYLAAVAFAEGRLALSEARPKVEAGPRFAEALQSAANYSPFLLERMLTELLTLLKEHQHSSRSKILNDLLAQWVRLDMKAQERERQGEEYEAQKERVGLIDRIRREYPEAKAPERDETPARDSVSSGAPSGGEHGGKVPVKDGTPKNGDGGDKKSPDGQAGVLVTLTKLAGVAGLAGGLFFMLFAKLAFPTLDGRQATLFMILAYSFGALLLVVAAAKSPKGGRTMAGLLAALSVVMLVIGVSALGSSASGVYTVAVTVRSPGNSLVEDAQISCSPPCNPKKVSGGWEIPIAGDYAKTKREIRVLAEVADRGWQSETEVQLGNERFQTVKLQLQEQGELPVRGVVVDSNGNGIPNARVGRYGEPTINTDQNGGFVLNTHAAKNAKVKLRAAKEPYAPEEVEYEVGSEDLKITLQYATSKGASQRSIGRPAQPQSTVGRTGDKVIDDVLANLTALKQNGHVPTESELSSTLAPLFSRPAFYRGIREEQDWRYFLYPLCRTRQLLEQYVGQFKSNPQVRQNLSLAIQKMAALEARVGGLYGPTFSLTEHIDLYIGNKQTFIDHLPSLMNQPSANFLDERDREIHEICDIVRKAGFPVQG
jgi:tetratricopeptide (TPR) repeat protein